MRQNPASPPEVYAMAGVVLFWSFGPTCSVDATALAQYQVTGWSAVIPPPTETWSMPVFWLLTKPVAFRISWSFT